jgi:hypothetical protein
MALSLRRETAKFNTKLMADGKQVTTPTPPGHSRNNLLAVCLRSKKRTFTTAELNDKLVIKFENFTISDTILIFAVDTRMLWPGSSAGIATGYGLDGPGIEFRRGRDFSHLSRPALGPTQPPVQWVQGLSQG